MDEFKKGIRFVGILLVVSNIIVTACFAETVKDVLAKMETKFNSIKQKVHTIKMIAETEAYLGGNKILTKNIIYQKGNKVRSETTPLTTIADMPKDYLQTVSIFDGKNMWVISKSGVQKLPIEERDVDQMKPVSSLGWIKELANSLKLKGEKQVNGQTCYVLGMQTPYKLVLYVDKNLLDWVEVEQESPQGEKVRIIRRDFVPIKKGDITLVLPRRIEIYVNGKLMAITTIKHVELNIPLKDSLFVVKTQKARSLPTKANKVMQKMNSKNDKSSWNALEKLGK